MNNLKGKEIEQLMELICQLGPVEFAGLATMMKIPLVEEDEQKTPRSFVEVFEDVLKKFPSLPRKLRRDIKKMLREVVTN